MDTKFRRPTTKGTGSTDSLVDLALGRLSAEESLQKFVALEKDRAASARLETIVDLMFLASEKQDNIFEGRNQAKTPRWSLMLWKLEEFFRMRPVLYPLVGLLLLLIGLGVTFLYTSMERNRYEELVGIDRTAFEWNVRGAGNDDIETSYRLFSQGKYSESATRLERYLRTHPQDESGWYVHYCLGSVHLISAKTTYLSLITSYDATKVRRGLTELELSARGTNNMRLEEESRLLMSKGLLILGLADSAIAELQSIHRLNGQRKSEALQMIDRIKSISGGAER